VDEAFDIIIAGGGPVGAAAALGLSRSGLKLALIDARVPGAPVDDGRSIALSRGSQLILDRLGVWPALAAAATAITQITISQQRAFGRAELKAEDAGVPALGYVAGYAALQHAFAAALAASPCSVITGSQVREVEGDADGAVAILDGERRLTATPDRDRRWRRSARHRARQDTRLQPVGTDMRCGK
jgi:2-octaprenyl-6-methoxyphenol hydroxylase